MADFGGWNGLAGHALSGYGGTTRTKGLQGGSINWDRPEQGN